MSGKCYQTYGMQRKERRSEGGASDCSPNSVPVSLPSSRVNVSTAMAQKIRSISDSFGISEEILATEAIKQGFDLLES